MVILEDDVMFHPKWKDLAPEYFQNTPKNFDVLYLGAQFEFNSKFHIDIGPVFCTHAMVVTYNGAKKLWEMLLNRKLGVYTIDCMIIDSMKHRLMTMNNENSLFKSNPFTWYVWNGNFYPTEIKNMPKDSVPFIPVFVRNTQNSILNPESVSEIITQFVIFKFYLPVV